MLAIVINACNSELLLIITKSTYHKYSTIADKFASVKHTNLFRKSVSYAKKCFILLARILMGDLGPML
jgi:hypothetical protein